MLLYLILNILHYRGGNILKLFDIVALTITKTG